MDFIWIFFLQIPKEFNHPEKVIINGKEIEHPLPKIDYETNFSKTQGFIHQAKFVREFFMKGNYFYSLL